MADQANNLLANEMFRFTSVRAANSHSEDAINRRFVKCFIDFEQIRKNIKDFDPNNPQKRLLILELPKLANNPNAEDEMLRMVSVFKQSSDWKLTINDFNDSYPHQQLSGIYLWYRDNKDKVTLKNFTDKIKAALGKGNSLADFIKLENKLKIWENLIAEYIEPNPPEFLEELQQIARWIWLIEKIEGKNSLKISDDIQEISEALNATVILPDNSVYYKPKVSDSEPKVNETNNNVEKNKEIDRLKDLTHAQNEINTAHKNQEIDNAHSAKYCNDSGKEKPPAQINNIATKIPFLGGRRVESLSAKTHSVIDSYRIPKTDGLDVSHIRDRITQEKNIIIDKYFGTTKPPVVININNKIFQIDNLCVPETIIDPCAPYTGATLPKGRGLIRTPGVADLKVVKTTLLKYEKGEIAHIENILKGEKKVREFNITKRTEESILTEEETTSETEKETQTTDRFELEKEVSSQVKEDMKFDTGVKVSAKLGPVQLDTHLDFTYNKSKEESNKTATKSSQETMNKALSKLIERKKTQRTVTTIITTEEKNNHTLENKDGKDHIHGLYHWVDKYYLAKVVNYGQRLMFEFIVPEPAAFYIFSKAHEPIGENAKVRPEFPSIFSLNKLLDSKGKEWMEPLRSFKDIAEDNYAELAAKYNAQDVIPPPSGITIIADNLSYERPREGEKPSDNDKLDFEFIIKSDKLRVPAGYIARHADVSIAADLLPSVNIPVPDGKGGVIWQTVNPGSKFSILVGNQKINSDNQHDFTKTIPLIALNIEDAVVPFSVWGNRANKLACNVEIICDRTDRAMELWRKDIFNSIMKAYYDQLATYNNWLKEQEINSGITIQGNNPEINRRVEKEELKKHCIEMITGQRFEKFDAMRSNTKPWGYPEFSINEAFAEGKYIQFFEQAFEWEQMTYVFYPYFWGRKPNWTMIKSISDSDPVFTSFLQAGAARVLVPARPGFEGSIRYFYNTGRIWNGSNPPTPGDKLWVSIVDEIKAQQGQFEGGQQEGEPWIFKMPTSLVYLDSMEKPLDEPIYDLSKKYENDVKAAEKAKTSVDFT